MDGFRFRRGLAGDIPFFVGFVLVAGVLLGGGAGVAINVYLHRHRR